MKKPVKFLVSMLLAFTFILPAVVANAENVVLKQGATSDGVLLLQKRLLDLGYYQGNLDGMFGQGTYKAVTGFQSDNSLAADGIAGQATLQALNISTATVSGSAASGGQVLKQGSAGDIVFLLQKKLLDLGYYQGALDGNFGSGTKSAVARFQSDCGLAVDGIAGSETLRALQNNGPAAISPSRGQAGDRRAQTIASFAKQFLGVPYTWAGNSPSGFDCSGFTYYVFGQFGVDLPRMADGQFNAGVSAGQLQPGDLVFFSTYEPGPSHVGIYIGDNQFIHSSSGTGDVTITSLGADYYSARYLGARRVL